MGDYREEVMFLIDRGTRLIQGRGAIDVIAISTLCLQFEALAVRGEKHPAFQRGMMRFKSEEEWITAFKAVLTAFASNSITWEVLAERLVDDLSTVASAWNYTVFSEAKTADHMKLMEHTVADVARFQALWQSLESG